MSSRPKKYDNPWAGNGGDITPAPDATKRDVGFVKGERLKAPYWNSLMNGVENRINDIIAEGPGTWYPEATDISAMITTGLWDESWGTTDEAANTISAGSAKEIHDLAVYFSDDNEPRLLLGDNANSTVEIWDPRALSNIVTSDDLTADLPSGSGQTWQLIKMCTDGTDIYIVWTDTNASPDTHQIQAWTISETSGSWDVKSGWPTTGTALAGTGNGPANYVRDANIIIADSTRLAVSCGWTTVTAAGDPAIQLFLRATGAADADGAGDCPTGSSMQPTEGLCSNGTNILFTASDGTDSEICSLEIADPTSGGSGTSNYPYSDADIVANNLVACGSGMAVAMCHAASPAAADRVATIHRMDGSGSTPDMRRGEAPHGGLAELFYQENPMHLVFDGTNVWSLGTIDSASAGDELLALVKFEVSRVENLSTNQVRWFSDLCAGRYVINPTAGTASISSRPTDYKWFTTVFDGRDIWVNIEPRASQTYSGKLMRLPCASTRG